MGRARVRVREAQQSGQVSAAAVLCTGLKSQQLPK